MRSHSRRQVVVVVVSLAGWGVTLGLLVVNPDSESVLRLVYFAALGLAVSASALAAFPWMMADHVHRHVLAYVAGYMHREADEQAAGRHPDLHLIQGGR